MSGCDLDLNGKSMLPVFFKAYTSASLLYSFQKSQNFFSFFFFPVTFLRRGDAGHWSEGCCIVPGWSGRASTGTLFCI